MMAATKSKARKRHIGVDTLGLPIKCHVAAADIQDRATACAAIISPRILR
jgi:hypothetical protein